MNEDRYTPEEQQMTQQLSAAPKPKLKAPVRDTIRQQMLNEFRSTTNATPQRHIAPSMTRPILRVAALAAAVALIAIGLVFAQRSNPQSATLTTGEKHQTAEIPTSTSVLTLVADVSTQMNPLPTLTEPEATITLAPIQPPSATFESTLPAPTQLFSATFEPMLSLTIPTSIQQAPTQSPPAIFTPTPSLTILTPTAPEVGNAIVVIEGPITNIVDNVLTINDFNVQVAPDNPILSVIDVGDIVHVEGTLNGSDMILANVVSNVTESINVSGAPVTVGLDGPVESINGTLLIINSMPVRLDPNNPLVGKLHIGDFVRVEGNFQGSGMTTVLVVVNITIVNNVVVNGTPTCRYDVDAMGMGHWHCDGMGMGDEGMGMGMGDDGMGMGDPGMGMGP